MPINTADLLIFITASLALNLTPGNDMMFVLGQAMKDGVKSGVAASLGIATGSLIHLGLVALGVAAILNQHPMLFSFIRYAGAAYLVWTAYMTLRQTASVADVKARQRNPLQAWRDGTIVNLLNPKIIVFMFAFLPPFVRPESGSPLLQLLIFGAIFNIGGTLINIAVSVLSGRIATRILHDAKLARWLQRVSASLFLLLAARMAFERCTRTVFT
jgi:threonine/homoserine/homoserine lactone efflux protein